MKFMIQQTLVLIKPDAMERGLVGEIISRLERVGLKIVEAKIVIPTKEFARKHYPVTDEWFENVGNRSLSDCKKFGLDPKEVMGTDDPVKMGKMIHQWNVEFFTGKPVLALSLEGVHAVEVARKICGPTIPLVAPPGTIRGDFSAASALSENSVKIAVRNLVHASGTLEEAEREIKLWFGK